MSTKVRIKDFQSIGDIEFEIDGFTVVIGKNNIGKSAIIRALEAALTNKPGKGDIRLGKKHIEVRIQREGLDLEWKKGDKALYKINKEDFSALGAGVIPKPLSEAGFDKMEIGDAKISPLIATQFETPSSYGELFLINKSGSVVTQVLSTLYNINVLNEADSLCQKELKSNKAQLKTRENDLKGLQEKLEKFKGFEDLKREIEDLAKNEKVCDGLRDEIFQLSQYETQLTELQNSVKLLSAVKSIKIPEFSDCEKAMTELSWIEGKEEEFNSLVVIVRKLQSIKTIDIPIVEAIESLTAEVSQLITWDNSLTGLIGRIKTQKATLDSFNLKDPTDMAGKVEIMVKEVEEISFLYAKFYESAMGTKTARDELKRITEELVVAEKERAAIKVCPACERPL